MLNDGQEVLIFSTNPLQDDTDSDGLSDGTEVLVTFSNPLVFDDDGDSDGWYWFQDCNDSNPDVKPLQPELLDGIDNNCENGIDEGFKDLDSDNDRLSDWAEFHVQFTDWNNPDTDGDGMEDGDEVQVFFSDPTYTDPDDDSDGYYWFQDCDDNDSDRSPGLSEWLNGIDDDCDEDVDEDFLNTDADRDGLVDIDEYNIYMTKWQDADTDDDGLNDGYELFQGTNPLFADLDNDGDGLRWFQDCDDNNSNVNPYASEIRNGIDDNCNGEIDEGLPDLNPQILIVSYSSQSAEVNRNIAITAFGNSDTETILFDFEDSLQTEFSINQATVVASTPGIYRGEVCAVTEDLFNCESIVVEFTTVQEIEVE
ncbi:MAG: MopE-related protein, partial [Candidatus Thermoplasmatota archaeon]|nr:MopE-related protein [Candidatus Thermoplasmatota archaeon]